MSWDESSIKLIEQVYNADRTKSASLTVERVTAREPRFFTFTVRDEVKNEIVHNERVDSYRYEILRANPLRVFDEYRMDESPDYDWKTGHRAHVMIRRVLISSVDIIKDLIGHFWDDGFVLLGTVALTRTGKHSVFAARYSLPKYRECLAQFRSGV